MSVRRNLKVFLFYEIFNRFSPHFLIAPLYYQKILGSYAQAMSIFSVTLLSCAIAEIPMGIFSDIVGRKKTIISGSFFYLCSLLLFLLPGLSMFPPLLSCFGGAVLSGIAKALFSGTTDALLYESTKQLQMGERYKNIYSFGAGLGSLSSALAALSSGVIAYYFDYIYCFILSVISAFLLLLSSFMWTDVHHNREKITFVSVRNHLAKVMLLFKTNTRLGLLSIAKILGDNVSYRIDVIYFKMLIPEYLLGAPRMLKKVFECLSYVFAARLIEKINPLRTLVVSNIWMVGVRAAAVSFNNIASPFITSMVDLFDGTAATASSMLLHKEYADHQRATSASFINMVSTIWTSVLLLLTGLLIDYTSVRVALTALIFFRGIRFFIYYQLSRCPTEPALQ